MEYIKGHTYRIAFAYANTHAWAEILNFFKLDLNWLTRPTLKPEPLIRQISKYVLYFKKSDNFTQPQAENIVSFLKDIYDAIKDEVVWHEGKWASRISRSITTDYSDRMKGAYKKHECAECHHNHVALSCLEVGVEIEPHPQNPNYVICSECGTPQRLKEEELTWDDNEFYEQDDWDLRDDVDDVLNEWINAAPDWANCAWVEGWNLNWRGSNGYTSTSLDVDSLLSVLTVRGDYTLELRLIYDGTMEATCAHHDATSGYLIQYAAQCDMNGDALDPGDLEMHIRCAKVLNVFEGCDTYEHIHEDELLPALEMYSLHPLVTEMINNLGLEITVEQAQILNEMNQEMEQD